MKKIFFILALALLMASLLCACTTNGNEGDTSQATDDPTSSVTESGSNPDGPEVPENKLVIVDKDGKCDYTIIRPQKAGSDILSAMRELRAALSAIGTKPGLDTDTAKVNLSEYEILIGSTRYEDTTVPIPGKDYLENDDYIISVIGTRVVIRGGSEKSVTRHLLSLSS